MSKVRTVMGSVGIEAAVRPICGKGRARANDNGKTLPFYLFVDHDGYHPVCYTRITDSDHSLGHGGGASLPPKSIYRKSKRSVELLPVVRVVCPSVEILMRHNRTLSIRG